MRSELREEVLGVIGAPGRHTHLAILLLSAMAGTDLAEELGETIAAILLDPGRTYAERYGAAHALREAAIVTDWEVVLP